MGPFSAGILERSYLLPSFLSLAKVYAIEGRLKPVNRIFTIPLFFFIYETKMLVIAFSTSSLLFHAVCTRKKCFFSPCIFRALRERERESAQVSHRTRTALQPKWKVMRCILFLFMSFLTVSERYITFILVFYGLKICPDVTYANR